MAQHDDFARRSLGAPGGRIEIMSWPDDWQDRLTGAVCRFCTEGRPSESRVGLRFHAGEVTDAYLARRAMARGYAVVIWRGRHVVEPHHLSAEESVRFHGEVLRVGAQRAHA
ncbi:hypothetical protein O1R50_21215 [Glycomyces luteolus]|uniref:Uncharacterized protein n=1 Tax=Glycomyces luteolus TaxID=2670330 RepID=A0A9X3PES8_9ACTN|nr:hypothetical protein [Glycomyces luteolus]MDA1362160.1 hypothetical protein [Glycomyces luteolus]